MKICITGGAGFIGFHLAQKLFNEGHEVYGFDNFNDYYDPSLKTARQVKLAEMSIPIVDLDLNSHFFSLSQCYYSYYQMIYYMSTPYPKHCFH